MPSLTELFPPGGEQKEIPPEVQKCLFDCLRLKNGVYKTTYAHRLDDLNARIAAHLPDARPLEVLDVGISSGVSTVEWIESLERATIDHHVTGIDLTTRGWLVSFGDHLHAVLDETTWPLLFEIDSKWLSNPPRKRERVRHCFSLALIRIALALWRKKFGKPQNQGVGRVLGMRTRAQSMNLVTPMLVNHPRVTITQGSILTEASLAGSYHVIRAANILNRGYFGDGELMKMLRNLRYHLADQGILAVCCTDSDETGVNRGTVFRVGTDSRFLVLSRLNGGSEIEDLALCLPGV